MQVVLAEKAAEDEGAKKRDRGQGRKAMKKAQEEEAGEGRPSSSQPMVEEAAGQTEQKCDEGMTSAPQPPGASEPAAKKQKVIVSFGEED